MAWVNSGVNAYVRQLISPQLYSSYAQTHPLLYFMAGKSIAQLQRIGRANQGVILGGARIGQGKREQLQNSIGHQFRFQKAQTDTASAVTEGGTTPTASVFAEDSMGTAESRWCHFWNPLKVREDNINAAKGDLQIANLIEEAVGQGFQRHLEQHQSALWTGTLTSAGQNNQVWTTHLGIKHVVDDGTTMPNYRYVYRTDRTTETQLKANVIPAATLVANGVLTNYLPKLVMVRQILTNNTYGGLINKAPGAGSLCITTPDLWNILATEAEGKHQFFYSGIPQFDIAGFKYPVIVYDNTFITYDNDCPAGDFFVLTPESWVYEIHGAANFKVEGWVKKYLTEEGGGYYRWTQIHAQTRWTCTEPWLQCKVSGLTAAADGSSSSSSNSV